MPKRSGALSPKLTVGDWQAMAASESVHSRIVKDPYCVAYQHIMKFFSSVEIIDWDAAIVGLHIVYGWMPTIPKLKRTFAMNLDQRGELLEVLNSARTGNKIDCEDLEKVKSFSNNSVVGGSKLLHFINPRTCPIWDSRVAKVFWGKGVSAYSLSRAESWVEYRDTLTQWAVDAAVQATCADLRWRSDGLVNTTDMRVMELVMFHGANDGGELVKNG